MNAPAKPISSIRLPIREETSAWEVPIRREWRPRTGSTSRAYPPGRLLPGDALKPIPPSHPPAPTPAPQTLYVKYRTLTSQIPFG